MAVLIWAVAVGAGLALGGASTVGVGSTSRVAVLGDAQAAAGSRSSTSKRVSHHTPRVFVLTTHIVLGPANRDKQRNHRSRVERAGDSCRAGVVAETCAILTALAHDGEQLVAVHLLLPRTDYAQFG